MPRENWPLWESLYSSKLPPGSKGLLQLIPPCAKALLNWNKRNRFIIKKGNDKLLIKDNELFNDLSKKILKGVITSAKNDKTVVVEVVRKFKHPFYEKVIKRSKKYHAHDEKNKFKEGQKVSIIESKPFSKKKTWQVIEKWYKFKLN